MNWLKANWRWLVTTIMGLVGWAAAAYYAASNGQPIPPPPPVIIPETPTPPPPQSPFGWYDDPAEVAAVVAQIPIKGFRDTPAFAGENLPDHIYLWEAARRVRGSHIPTRNQGQVGSCVAFGSACAVEYLECVQIASGKPEAFKDIAQEVIYGGSRVQIGGGRISGDGSTGAWAAQWAQKYGEVARGTYGSVDLTAYNESRCRQYGRSGCPKELESIARERPVKSITTVKTPEECRSALANGYPVTVASSVGFGQSGPYVRDSDGFLRASGTWPHQMCFIGFQTGNRPGFYCMNSWGEGWVSGPTGAGAPPPGGFWVDDRTAARMLGEGDSWAYGDLEGFPGRKLPPWFIQERKPRDPFEHWKWARRPTYALAW